MIFQPDKSVRTVGPVQADEASKRNADIGMTRNARRECAGKCVRTCNGQCRQNRHAASPFVANETSLMAIVLNRQLHVPGQRGITAQ
jgi:hypothetical protein